jgi:Cas7 group CRISPR-associated protein Csh2
VWQSVHRLFDSPLATDNFGILESRGRIREQIRQEIKDEKFLPKYWDARVFGNTFLEEDLSQHLRTGVVQFGLGVSVSPIRVERLTTTNKSGVQEGKDRGMAPLGYRIVQHAVYYMPFFVNPTAARKSGCTATDVDLLLKVIPFAYSHTAAYNRAAVEIRHAWYVEHKSPLGSASDFAIIDALMPTRKSSPELPSTSWGDYEVPTSESLATLAVRDLMAEAYATAVGA